MESFTWLQKNKDEVGKTECSLDATTEWDGKNNKILGVKGKDLNAGVISVVQWCGL